MCGIVAYLGSREAYPILIKGLHRLEHIQAKTELATRVLAALQA